MSINDPWTICDVSGFKCRKSETRKRWDGMIVRKDFCEPRHPQDFVKVPREAPPDKNLRPDQTDPAIYQEFDQSMIV